MPDAAERQQEPDEGAEIASAHPDREGVDCDNHEHPPLLDVAKTKWDSAKPLRGFTLSHSAILRSKFAVRG